MEISQTNLVFKKKNNIKDDYDFIKEIGIGSYSKVYKVKDKINYLYRCVKKIYKKRLTPEEQNKIIDEVKILKNLDHPNILNIIAFYENKTYFFIVSEYLRGGEWFEKIIKDKKMNENIATEYMSQILNAVNYLHSHGIVHRDLKPENIIFESSNEDSYLKIIDFGISTFYKNKILKEKTGTIYYIAPEVLNKNYDNKCDVWSCGVIWYILLSGYPPFNGSDDKEILKNIESGIINFPKSDWKKISNETIDLIQKMLTFNPKYRFSAEDCLNHNFFKNKKDKLKSNDINIKNFLNKFKKFNCKFKFQKAMIMYSIKIFNIKNEKDKILKTFKLLDENGDGQLSKEELLNGFEKLNISILKEDIIKIFNEIDVNKTGFLDFTEFAMAVMNQKLIFQKKKIKYLFKMIDLDGNGTITHSELKEFFNFEENINNDINLNEFVWNMIKEVDTNNDGVINFEEFENMLSQNLI